MEKFERFKFKRDSDNGMVVGEDGCHYETEADAMYFSLGCCGCGNPDLISKFIVDCLSAKDDEHPAMLSHKKIVGLINENPDLVAQFVLHILDDKGLTEHGSSVYGSWLTERGKQFVEIGAMG